MSVVEEYLTKYPEPNDIDIVEISLDTKLEDRLPQWDCEYLRANHAVLLKNKTTLRSDLYDKLSLFYAIEAVSQVGFDAIAIYKYVSALERSN